jgi:hypothetical protein
VTKPYRILLPPGMPLLSSNQRLHYMEKWRRAQNIKKAAWAAALQAKTPQLLRASITVIVHPGPRTRLFDPHNYTDSAKYAIDGLVMAGVLPKDDSRYLRRVSIVDGERSSAWQLELLVRPVNISSPTSAPEES